MKKFISAVLALVLVLSCTSAAFAVDEGVDTLSATPMGEAEIEKGFEDAEVIVVSLPSELISVTEEIDPNKQVTKTFNYRLQDGNNVYLTGVKITVTGTYSREDNYAQIDSVTVILTNSNTTVKAGTPHYNRDRDEAVVTLSSSDGIALKTYRYKISPTGIISDISSKQDT